MRINARIISTLTLAVAIMAVAVVGCGRKGPEVSFERRVLDNGATVIVQRVAGVNRAAMKVFYRTGFMDDGQGTPQMARFAEALWTKSATKGFKPGAAWDFIMSRGGHTSAETMPQVTHFTYIVPIVDVGAVLQIEMERLQSLQYDREVAEFELQQCYKEMQDSESQPAAPVLTYAAMAANQLWRYGTKEVNLSSGLDSLSADAALAYINAHYAPERLIIVITGGLRPKSTIDFIEKHLSSVPRSDGSATREIDWNALPEQTELHWDSPVNGVFLWFKPPVSESERIQLSLWGDTFGRTLAKDPRTLDVARFIATSSFTWSVGEMPFFVYATLRDSISPETAVPVLRERVDHILTEFSHNANPAPIIDTAKDFAELEKMDLDIAIRQAAFLKRDNRLSDDEALEFILIRHSLNLGLRECLFGDPASGRVQEARDLIALGVQGLLTDLVDSSVRGVTVLRGTAEH